MLPLSLTGGIDITHDDIVFQLGRFFDNWSGCNSFKIDHIKGGITPSAVGGFIPDVEAFLDGKRVAIGDAKTPEDIAADPERIKQQFKAWAPGEHLLVIMVPQPAHTDIDRLLTEAGIKSRSKVRILTP